MHCKYSITLSVTLTRDSSPKGRAKALCAFSGFFDSLKRTADAVRLCDQVSFKTASRVSLTAPMEYREPKHSTTPSLPAS